MAGTGRPKGSPKTPGSGRKKGSLNKLTLAHRAMLVAVPVRTRSAPDTLLGTVSGPRRRRTHWLAQRSPAHAAPTHTATISPTRAPICAQCRITSAIATRAIPFTTHALPGGASRDCGSRSIPLLAVHCHVSVSSARMTAAVTASMTSSRNQKFCIGNSPSRDKAEGGNTPHSDRAPRAGRRDAGCSRRAKAGAPCGRHLMGCDEVSDDRPCLCPVQDLNLRLRFLIGTGYAFMMAKMVYP